MGAFALLVLRSRWNASNCCHHLDDHTVTLSVNNTTTTMKQTAMKIAILMTATLAYVAARDRIEVGHVDCMGPGTHHDDVSNTVKFSKTFDHTPVVFTSIQAVDGENDGADFMVVASDVTKRGFKLRCTALYGANIQVLRVNWIVFPNP